DYGTRSDKMAKQQYQSYYGPTYYSFTKGKIHYVMLDNVHYQGSGHSYSAYLSEDQFQWLEQDLSRIPHETTVVVTMHIPSQYKPHRTSSVSQVLQNADALYHLLTPYKAHLFSGHTHIQEHFVIHEKLIEHNHASVSGIFWQTPMCADGTPPGYL